MLTVKDFWKSFIEGYCKGRYGDDITDRTFARKKNMLKQYPEYPIIYDLNIGIMGEDWSFQKTDEVNKWLKENFPDQWLLLTHYSEQGFACDIFYHFVNEEIAVAFKLRWE